MTDPTPDLLPVMENLERAIHWRPRPDLSLAERIYHFAEGALALKEIEFLGRTCSGPLSQRLADLIDFILNFLEVRHGVKAAGVTVPERVKAVRQQIITRLTELPADDPLRRQGEQDLEDVFLVVQLFSYPGDYVAQQPTVERLAETLDKFEEDMLHIKTAGIRGARTASITFGEPIPVSTGRTEKRAAAALTRTLEQQVQSLLDQAQGNVADLPWRVAAG